MGISGETNLDDLPGETADLPARLAAAIAAAGSAEFAQALINVSRGLTRQDGALALIYRPDRRPEIVLNKLKQVGDTDRSPGYVAGAYLLDPFYLLARRLGEPAFKRMIDIAPTDFESSHYYATYYKTGDVTDEVNYLFPISGNRVFALCIERTVPSAAFSDDELRRLAEWLPTIAALVSSHFSRTEADTGTANRHAVIDSEHIRLKTKLSRFATSVLTPREIEVVRLLLDGLDTQALAQRLDVSQETVRVHRRNIYKKLNVTSIAGLFSLALSALLASGADENDPLSTVQPATIQTSDKRV